MNELKIFNNPAFGEIRALNINGDPWFVGRDVCVTFGDTNPNRSLGRIDEQDKMRYVIQTAGGAQEATLINESGLYALLFAMQPEKANKGGTHMTPPFVQERIDKLHAFKRWVTSEVLPSIRKTGGYIAGQETMTDAELLSKAFIVATKTIEQRNARILSLESDKAALQAQIEADAPRVMWAKVAEGSKDGMLIREFVKFLRPLGVVIGEKRMFADLREKGYLIKAEGRDHNKPTQKAMELGLFTVKERLVSTSDGETKLVTTPLLTEKGKQYFTKMYLTKTKNALTVNAAASV